MSGTTAHGQLTFATSIPIRSHARETRNVGSKCGCAQTGTFPTTTFYTRASSPTPAT